MKIRELYNEVAAMNTDRYLLFKTAVRMVDEKFVSASYKNNIFLGAILAASAYHATMVDKDIVPFVICIVATIISYCIRLYAEYHLKGIDILLKVIAFENNRRQKNERNSKNKCNSSIQEPRK